MLKASKTITTAIIPDKPTLIGEKDQLDLKAICVFLALGFFLDDDTYYLGQKALKPASKYTLDENNNIVSHDTYFKWHYNPEYRSLKDITGEFAELFEQIMLKQIQEKTVILPLSGGIDSRTQAAALKHLGIKVNTYSYKFSGGHNETRYAKKIAQVCNFPFKSWVVPKGYLWDKIENLSALNGCYSEFTHPRQMAFSGCYGDLGDVFSLGHWGDVLFDDMGVVETLPIEQQVDVVLGKMIKKGGVELATGLWKVRGIEGSFKDYLYQRVRELLYNIDIPDSANARIRAFKSLYWAPRWTSVNFEVFRKERPTTLPYYSNEMCKFICSLPEAYLANRQVQIAYLKMRNPNLSKITWQQHRPFNLYNYHLNKVPYNLPYRVFNKFIRVMSYKRHIQRNWELQFLGVANEQQLEYWLFENHKMNQTISKGLTKSFYGNFRNKNALYYAHPVSMLLTLSLFFNNKEV